jgi:hypothetical protein
MSAVVSNQYWTVTNLSLNNVAGKLYNLQEILPYFRVSHHGIHVLEAHLSRFQPFTGHKGPWGE